MKVILKNNNQVKEVTYGYAVNYLLPKGLAEIATPKKIKVIEVKLKEQSKLQLERQKENKALASKLEAKKIKFEVKAGKGKKIYGSINKKDILQKLQLDPKRVEIILEKQLKKIGKHEVLLKIGDEKVVVIVELAKN
ncbi:50S ribosomal protein L9 [Patescibacteria group bacterium]